MGFAISVPKIGIPALLLAFSGVFLFVAYALRLACSKSLNALSNGIFQ